MYHQSSALSPLLCVTVTEALSREFRVALSWELLYTDDTVVTAETEDDLIKRLNEWKHNMENRGMQKIVRWPRGVCDRGIGNNSIQCINIQCFDAVVDGCVVLSYKTGVSGFSRTKSK